MEIEGRRYLEILNNLYAQYAHNGRHPNSVSNLDSRNILS